MFWAHTAAALAAAVPRAIGLAVRSVRPAIAGRTSRRRKRRTAALSPACAAWRKIRLKYYFFLIY
jgi:hypothetical protein